MCSSDLYGNSASLRDSYALPCRRGWRPRQPILLCCFCGASKEPARLWSCTDYIATRSPSPDFVGSSLPEGAFDLCVPKVRLLFLTSTAFVDTKTKPRIRRGKNYKVKRALKSSRPRRASKSFQVRYSLKSSVKVDVPLQVTSFES